MSLPASLRDAFTALLRLVMGINSFTGARIEKFTIPFSLAFFIMATAIAIISTFAGSIGRDFVSGIFKEEPSEFIIYPERGREMIKPFASSKE
ncbi:hypothetical protein D3C85_1639920 [compost metagenome]